MNGYVCFYRGKRIEIYATTSYEAQMKAAAQFKARKSHEVSVMLAEKAGEPVQQNGASLAGACHGGH